MNFFEKLLEDKGVDIFYGKPRQLSRFSSNYRFVVLAGNFKRINVALPLVSGKILKPAFYHLNLHKGRTLKNKILIYLLRIFNYPFVYNLFFKKQIAIKTNLFENNFFSFLNSILNKKLVFSVFLTGKKFCLPLFDENNKKLVAFAKVYFPERKENGEWEAFVLQELKKVGFVGISFPDVIFQGYFKDFFIEILSTSWDLKNFNKTTKEHLRCLKKIKEKTKQDFVFEKSPFYKEIKEELAFLKNKEKKKFYLVQHLFNKAVENLKNKKFVFSLTKREFPYFELLKRKKELFVVDWEHSRFGFPAIFDFYSMLLSEKRRKKYEDFFSKRRPYRLLPGFFEVDISSAFYFFILFLVDQLYIYLKSEDFLNAEKIFKFLKRLYKNENYYKNNWKFYER